MVAVTGGRPKAVSDVKQLNYSSFGAAVSEVEIDVLTGEKLILRSDILFDCGNSFNPAVDVGQVPAYYHTSAQLFIAFETPPTLGCALDAAQISS